jgi:hypothetical protein
MIEILFVIVLTIVGGYITWRHGETKFQEGVTAALINYHDGKIDYEIDQLSKDGYRIKIINKKQST